MTGLGKWWKRNKAPIILIAVTIAISTIIIPFIGKIFASKDTMQSLIEAEATLLGFFGLILTYNLSSVDTRIDRLEQQRFDCEIENQKDRAERLNRQLNKIKKSRTDRINLSGVVASFFVICLVISITALSLIEEQPPELILLSVTWVFLFTVAVCMFILILLGLTSEFDDN